MKRFLVALSFLTIIPIKIKIKEEELENSMIFFPLVGFIIGSFLGVIRFLSSELFPPLLTAVLVVCSWSAITGSLHLEGFCDLIDGICGGGKKEEVLKIMEDPKIGAKGSVGLFFLLLIKICALFSINTSLCLFLAPSMGRWAMVIGATSPYIKDYGIGKAFFINNKKKNVIFSTIIMLIIGICLFKWHFFLILASVGGAIYLFIIYIKKRLGGLCGDALGALCEIIEVISLLSICFLS